MTDSRGALPFTDLRSAELPCSELPCSGVPSLGLSGAVARRDFLKRGLLLAGGCASLELGLLGLIGCGRDRGAPRTAGADKKAGKSGVSRGNGRHGPRPDAAEAERLLRTVSRPEALSAVADLLDRGLSHDALRAALVAFWAGIDGDIHGGLGLHALLAIERELPPRQRVLALLRAVDLGVSQRLAWRPMPPRPPVRRALLGKSVSDLTTDLRAAFTALRGDEVRMLVRALHQRWGQEAVSAELLRMTARDDGAGGHGGHLVVAGLDMLRTVRWHAADAVLDQVADRLQPPGSWQAPPSPAARAAFARQERLVTEQGKRWARGVRQMQDSRALRRAARTARGDALEAQIRAALTRGVHPDALWDGLALAAVDMALVDPQPSGPGAHALLLIAALRQAARRAPTPQAQLLPLLGAAWRLPTFRPTGRAMGAPLMVTATEVEPLRLVGTRKRRADAIRTAAGGGGAKALAVRDSMRGVTLRKALPDLHWLELPVAVTRLAAVAAPPFQGEILAGGVSCLVDASAPDWARLKEADALMAKLRS